MKTVYNAVGKAYRYNYFAHYAGIEHEKRKIRWRYIGKLRVPNEASEKVKKSRHTTSTLDPHSITNAESEKVVLL